MIASPRIVAVDDTIEDLHALVSGLSRAGAACLPVHFPEGATDACSCPGVRIIFADLHLDNSSASGEPSRHYSIIGSLIQEKFVPTGPYVIILWTMYEGHAEALQTFLRERLTTVPPPVKVLGLDKTRYLVDKAISDPAAFVAAIRDVVRQQSQLACLLDWEERVLGAAADTVSEIAKLANDTPNLQRILYHLAVEAVGQGNLSEDHFRAVNESLLPILADRISALKSEQSMAALWKEALQSLPVPSSLPDNEAARLNKFVHIDIASSGLKASVRGAVSVSDECYEPFWLGKMENGEKRWLLLRDLASKQFGCKEAEYEKCRWLLVQIQAACDYAQQKPGPLPLILALEMPALARRNGGLPDAIWMSPIYSLASGAKILSTNCRFQICLPKRCLEFVKAEYRLRDSLLTELTHHVHSQGGRPGKIYFEARKK